MTVPVPSPRLIVVVDDDPAVRRSIERVLRAFGYRSVSFSGMLECLAAPEIEQAACVVADIAMPGGTGLELTQALQEQPRRTPVVLITANDSEDVRQEARRVGAAGFLRKPVDAERLVEAIEAAGVTAW